MIQIAFALSFILPNFVHSDENRPADVYAEFQIEIEAQLKRAVDNVSFNRDSFAINTFRLLSLSREIFSSIQSRLSRVQIPIFSSD